MKTLRAPFPWFGGKSRAAEMVWQRFGNVSNYVEPFFGSGAILLARPHPPGIETVNDLDCYIANFWRALQANPVEVARWADWPVNEADLHARHLWLVRQDLFRERMKADPEYFDAKIAGWWVWGISCWIGSGWCSRPEWSGRISACRAERGVHRTLDRNLDLRESDDRRPHIGRGGMGVHTLAEEFLCEKKRPDIKKSKGIHSGSPERHLLPLVPDAASSDIKKQKGIHSKRPNLNEGKGVVRRELGRQMPDLHGNKSAAGHGVHASGKRLDVIQQWMHELSDRLRRVRICCGDWKRVLGRSPTECIGQTAIFLDPPYSDRAERRKAIYAEDCLQVAHEVREWCLVHGDNPMLRIALCGYDGEHEMPDGWTMAIWKANGGHGNTGQGRGRANSEKERIWFSPACLKPEAELFA